MEVRGFMFTIDAIIAVTAIILLLGAWSYVADVKHDSRLDSAKIKSMDSATIGFYYGENGNQQPENEFACSRYIKYNGLHEVFSSESFCEGLE